MSGPPGMPVPPGRAPATAWTPALRTLAEVDSTNRYLREAALQGAPAGLAVRADHQRAGRGRMGRTWEAPPGSSLLLSVLLRPVLAVADLHLCPLLVALSAADACGALCGVDPALKWPNDLVVDDRKLAGVLAEVLEPCPGGRPGSTAMVVGIGLNVRWPGPPGVGGTCLADLVGGGGGVVPTPGALCDALLGRLGRRVGDLEDPASRGRLVAELSDRCATLGRRVRVELGDQAVIGTAEAIGSSGQLVVRDDAGHPCSVAAGDVVHLRPA